MKLFTIPFSHYCELARWALRHSGAEFTERQALPGMHAVLFPRKPDGSRSTPFLTKDDGEYLLDSWSILEFADIGPAVDPEVKSLLDKDIGISARAILYSHILHKKQFYDLVAQGPFMQRSVLWLFGRPLSNGMYKSMVRSPEYIEECHKRVDAAVERLEAKMGLTGPPDTWDLSLTPTAIAAASLFAPLVNPPDYAAGSGYNISGLESVPSLKAEIAKYRATNLGQYVLKVYELHRKASA